MTMLAREAGPVQASSLQLANGRWSWWLVRLVVSIYYSGAGWSRSWTNIAPEARIGGYLIDNSNTNILSTKFHVHSWRTINYSIIKNLHKTYRFWYEIFNITTPSLAKLHLTPAIILKFRSSILLRQMFQDKEQCMTKAEANEQPQKFAAGCCMLGVAWLGWKCNIQIKQYPTRHQSKYHYEPNHNMKSAVISPSWSLPCLPAPILNS